jgi:hypothetical protein
MPRKIKDLRTYLASKIAIAPNGCWEWSGGRNKSGYGKIKFGGKDYLTHRVSYAVNRGISVDDVSLMVLHSCDNPPCINPEHLREGTCSDNILEAYAKGRASLNNSFQNGEKNPRSKLLQSQVVVIKSLIKDGKMNTEIAELFGVHHATVSLIRRGNIWGWVNP